MFEKEKEQGMTTELNSGVGCAVMGDAAIQVLRSPAFSHLKSVSWGECDVLDAILVTVACLLDVPIRDAFGPTPQMRHKRVLDGLEGDPRFQKFLFRCVTGPGNRERMVRTFRLTERSERK